MAVPQRAQYGGGGGEEGEFWRWLTLPQEETSRLWTGRGYRWFRAENVVAIEHFRRPREPGQRAGRFGWVKI
jgi:hypothetical protein